MSASTNSGVPMVSARAVFLVVIAVIWVFPAYWLLNMSLQPNDVLLRSTNEFLPDSNSTLRHYVGILSGSSTLRWLVNSIIVSTCTVFYTLLLASLGGYAFGRLEFPFKRTLFVLVLGGLAIPEQAVFIPLYSMFSDWKMHNTHAALFLPRLATPFGVFLMTQYFRGIPKEYEEAAKMDNASHWTIFTKVMLPLARPALITLAIFTLLYTWNDYLWPLVSASKTEMFTITVGMASYQGNYAQTVGLGFLMATAVFASLPILLMYVIFQKYVVSGIAMSSGK